MKMKTELQTFENNNYNNNNNIIILHVFYMLYYYKAYFYGRFVCHNVTSAACNNLQYKHTP